MIHFLQTATAPAVLPRLEPHTLAIDGVRGQGGLTKKGGWISHNKQVRPRARLRVRVGRFGFGFGFGLGLGLG